MNKDKLKTLISALAAKYKFRTGIIEKDFYITIILNNINEKLSEDLVLKGGTLLNKIYFNYERMSEDLDFTFISGESMDTRSKRSLSMRPIKEKMTDFLKFLGLKSPVPEGKGFDNSRQYVFDILYPSVVTGKTGNIKLEISLKQFPILEPVRNEVGHFFKDPFSGKSLISNGTVLSLALREAVAEKLKAAITRKEPAIRDFYDLSFISKRRFDFTNPEFIGLFKKKLQAENFIGDYKKDFGFDKKSIANLHNQINSALIPVIKADEVFDLDEVFREFNTTFESMF